jgi:hypothetical protein
MAGTGLALRPSEDAGRGGGGKYERGPQIHIYACNITEF